MLEVAGFTDDDQHFLEEEYYGPLDQSEQIPGRIAALEQQILKLREKPEQLRKSAIQAVKTRGIRYASSHPQK